MTAAKGSDRTLAAIRADAATSDAEGRAQAAEMVTALTIGALAVGPACPCEAAADAAEET